MWSVIRRRRRQSVCGAYYQLCLVQLANKIRTLKHWYHGGAVVAPFKRSANTSILSKMSTFYYRHLTRACLTQRIESNILCLCLFWEMIHNAANARPYFIGGKYIYVITVLPVCSFHPCRIPAKVTVDGVVCILYKTTLSALSPKSQMLEHTQTQWSRTMHHKYQWRHVTNLRKWIYEEISFKNLKNRQVLDTKRPIVILQTTVVKIASSFTHSSSLNWSICLLEQGCLD